MLTTKKSTTLTGTVTIEDKQVVYLNASVSNDGSDNINQTIQDKALYIANKTEVRKDIAEFTEEFYALQDAEVTEE